MSLEADIEALRNAFREKNQEGATAIIERLDWANGNKLAEKGGNPPDFYHRLSFVRSLHISKDEQEAHLYGAKRVLAKLIKAGCNILLDTGAATSIREEPELLKVYVKAAKQYAYLDRHGQTPFHWAARLSACPGIRMTTCLRKGLDPNAPGDAGNTPLHGFWDAVWSVSPDIDGRMLQRLQRNLASLMEAGADPFIRNKHGRDAWGFMERAVELVPETARAYGLKELARKLHADYQASCLEKNSHGLGSMRHQRSRL